MTKRYELDGDYFILRNYGTLAAFTSFLPGLAGTTGIPIWSFYVNRGQGICSFGIDHKSNAILEFDPAYLAYEKVSTHGFRTFLRVSGEYVEPFSPDDENGLTEMRIEENQLHLVSQDDQRGLRTTVSYFVVPNEDYGGLVRRVGIANTGPKELQVEGLDGLPRLIPYGIRNGEYKEMANLLRSWSEVRNIANGVPLFTLRSTTADSAQVGDVEGGYFAFSQVDGALTPPIYDSWAIFGEGQSLDRPRKFIREGLAGVMAWEQCFSNKLPCAFTPFATTLEPNEQLIVDTIIGYAPNLAWLDAKTSVFTSPSYLDEKQREAKKLVDALLQDVQTVSAEPLFDRYIRQSYLDNLLRGGYPVQVDAGGKREVVHLFSRKHGDPERDYNFFSIEAQPYSQGNGNFRDVCQNRRNDALLHPFAAEANIRTFLDLIQADGYNPLEVQGTAFRVPKERREELRRLIEEIGTGVAETGQTRVEIEKGVAETGQSVPQIRQTVDGNGQLVAEKLKALCDGSFTLGQLALAAGANSPWMRQILALAKAESHAAFHEGYWVDHWVYVLELVENALKIYPDKRNGLLFENISYRFYNSPARVAPRSEKYVLVDGVPRQYHSVVLDEKKKERGWTPDGVRWLATEQGDEVRVGLYAKLFMLAAVKFATLDPLGMGIEMEANKPGWNDAMNGLPGLFGSSMGETLELKRLLQFLQREAARAEETGAKQRAGQNDTAGARQLDADAGLEARACEQKQVVLFPAEFTELLIALKDLISRRSETKPDAFSYWNACATAREQYREAVRFTVSGEWKACGIDELRELCSRMLEVIEDGIRRAAGLGGGLMPTFLSYTPVGFQTIQEENGKPALAPGGLPLIKVQAFEARALPLFLEGPVKHLGVMSDKAEALALHRSVRDSELYDAKLQMYKTSVSLNDEPMSIGRIRAFTPGWQERESVFLHMHYKYLLSMLRAGLYDNFFDEMKTAWLPFRSPETYGRSPLENSSFLASGVNPDPSLHGRGFVTRLSGSTTEVLSMWAVMMVGETWFTFDNDELAFTFAPIVPGWLFDWEGKLTFRLLSSCEVTYFNVRRVNTFGADAARVASMLLEAEGRNAKMEGCVLPEEWALLLRDGKLKKISIELR
jgi:hypothetical protein